MRVFSVLAAALCVCLAASAADAGTYVYKFSGTLDDGTTEFSGWFTFDGAPDDAGPGSGLGIYNANDASFIEWSVTIGDATYKSGGSDFQSDTVYVIDDSSEDDLLIYSSYESMSLDLEFVDSDATAFDGVSLDEPIHNLGWDAMSFALYDYSGSETVSFSGEIDTISQPLPPAVWTGFGLIAGIGFLRRIRRRR